MVDGVSPVLTNVLPPTIVIWVNVRPLVERSILNPVSLFELSVQDKSISVDHGALATRLLGAEGIGVGVGVGVELGGVVTLAVFE